MSKYTIQNEQGEVIARVNSKADADLFAAAHDLLEALVLAHSRLNPAVTSEKVMSIIENAIIKAVPKAEGK